MTEPVQPVQPIEPVRGRDIEVLDSVRSWLSRFIVTMHDRDLDLLTLWTAHTHVVFECYTTPRLVLDSPVPGSGKTTVLEHLERLTKSATQMASLSSPALLTRMLDAGPRTLLIDEADRSLDPKKDGVGELLAVLNSGYKRGGTRPVLVPVKGGGWQPKEMPTFAPVAMAGNNPALPEDTRSRCVRVLLMPDIDGNAEDSDWELHDDEARVLGQRLAAWAEQVRDEVRSSRPDLPEGVRGRNAEKWRPMARIAAAVGGRWPRVVGELASHDVEQQRLDREDGLITTRPHVALVAHLFEVWPDDTGFISTAELIPLLIAAHPDMWGEASSYGKALTPQRLGRMLVTHYGVNSQRFERRNDGARGYYRTSVERAWQRMGVTTTRSPDTGSTGGSGSTGSTNLTGLTRTDATPAENKPDTCNCSVCQAPITPLRAKVSTLCRPCEITKENAS